MYVKGEAFELKISRKMVETPSGQGSDVGYAGRWSCVEGAIKTELSIYEAYAWRGIVTDSEGRAGVLEGSGRVEEDSLLLTVISSSDPVVPGATLRLTLTTDGAKLGLFSNEDLSGRSLGTCTK
jgi:hypothetical protein